MVKAVVVDEPSLGRREPRPPIPLGDTMIYEAHVKGLTQLRQDVPPQLRGTFAGLCAPAMIDHLKRLGVTTIELLPIHAFLDDRFLVENGLVNYWGYNTIGFFAPEPRYAPATMRWTAFHTTVARLHDAGIEVMLDVVYNHTAEGDHLGPTLCFRGIDNASYYRLEPGQPALLRRLHRLRQQPQSRPSARAADGDRLAALLGRGVHVDGFRFDLATTLARGPAGFDRTRSFLTAIRQDPVLSRVKLIAEPWDLGPGGYQVGAFPVAAGRNGTTATATPCAASGAATAA